jgi:hypothetical protein
MKKLFKLFILSVLCAAGCFARPALASDEIVWLGLDYSYVKFIGFDEDFSDLLKIRDYYFGAWNHLVLTESEKYDVKAAFGAREVAYEMERAVERSRSRDMNGIIQTGSYELGKEQLASAIRAYIRPGDDRTGVLFIMETMDKLNEVSCMWIAAFNLSSGEILHLKRYSGKPGGFGFRNYWARPYYNVLSDLKQDSRKPF